MMNFMTMSYYFFTIGFIGFLFYQNHLLSLLLMMEFMVLGMFLALSIFLTPFFLSWVLLFLSFFLVCESVLGIACVILITRSQGNEMIANMTLLKC